MKNKNKDMDYVCDDRLDRKALFEKIRAMSDEEFERYLETVKTK